MKIHCLSEYTTSVHILVLFHQLGKSLEENKVLAKKGDPKSCQGMGVQVPFFLHTVMSAEEDTVCILALRLCQQARIARVSQ